jgi:hypothetical protein
VPPYLRAACFHAIYEHSDINFESRQLNLENAAFHFKRYLDDKDPGRAFSMPGMHLLIAQHVCSPESHDIYRVLQITNRGPPRRVSGRPAPAPGPRKPAPKNSLPKSTSDPAYRFKADVKEKGFRKTFADLKPGSNARLSTFLETVRSVDAATEESAIQRCEVLEKDLEAELREEEKQFKRQRQQYRSSESKAEVSVHLDDVRECIEYFDDIRSMVSPKAVPSLPRCASPERYDQDSESDEGASEAESAADSYKAPPNEMRGSSRKSTAQTKPTSMSSASTRRTNSSRKKYSVAEPERGQRRRRTRDRTPSPRAQAPTRLSDTRPRAPQQERSMPEPIPNRPKDRSNSTVAPPKSSSIPTASSTRPPAPQKKHSVGEQHPSNFNDCVGSGVASPGPSSPPAASQGAHAAVQKQQSETEARPSHTEVRTNSETALSRPGESFFFAPPQNMGQERSSQTTAGVRKLMTGTDPSLPEKQKTLMDQVRDLEKDAIQEFLTGLEDVFELYFGNDRSKVAIRRANHEVQKRIDALKDKLKAKLPKLHR